jgi:hypothetical protein
MQSKIWIYLLIIYSACLRIDAGSFLDAESPYDVCEYIEDPHAPRNNDEQILSKKETNDDFNTIVNKKFIHADRESSAQVGSLIAPMAINAVVHSIGLRNWESFTEVQQPK